MFNRFIEEPHCDNSRNTILEVLTLKKVMLSSASIRYLEIFPDLCLFSITIASIFAYCVQ